jgi:hypothetical protein
MQNIFVRLSKLDRTTLAVITIGVIATGSVLVSQAKAEIVKFQINDESPLATPTTDPILEAAPVTTIPEPVQPSPSLTIETKDNASTDSSHTTIETNTSGQDGNNKSETKITTDKDNKVTTDPNTNETVIDGGTYTIKLNGNDSDASNNNSSNSDDTHRLNIHSSSNQNHSLRVNTTIKENSSSSSH